MNALKTAALAVLLAVGTPAQAEEITIEIANFTFNPPEVTVKPGAKVVCKNADDIPHSVVAESGKFRSKPLDTGETFSMTFAEVGEIGYFCGLHPYMRGKVIVVPQADP
jgi:plastocyanin